MGRLNTQLSSDPGHFIQALAVEVDPAGPGPWRPALDNAHGLPGLAGQRMFRFPGSDRMYEFPGAAVTSDYKLGGLKRQKCILSQVWRPEI